MVRTRTTNIWKEHEHDELLETGESPVLSPTPATLTGSALCNVVASSATASSEDSLASLLDEESERQTPPPQTLPAASLHSLGDVAIPSLRVGIYGVAGRVSQALASLLWRHPEVTLVAIASRDKAGELFAAPSTGMPAMSVVAPEMFPVGSLSTVFLCATDDDTDKILAQCLDKGVKIVDLSRHVIPDVIEEATEAKALAGWERALEEDVIFGLTELFRDDLSGADVASTPGGYSTCAGLALGPLAQVGQLGTHTVVRDSTSAYMRPHSDAPVEIGMNTTYNTSPDRRGQVLGARLALQCIGADEGSKLVFTPMGVGRSRGLRLAFLTTVDDLTPQEIHDLYLIQYAPDHFVRVLPPGQKAQASEVLNTNVAAISIHPFREKEVMILSAIDTLYKGAAGQAIQNMNLMLGFDDTAGLHTMI